MLAQCHSRHCTHTATPDRHPPKEWPQCGYLVGKLYLCLHPDGVASALGGGALELGCSLLVSQPRACGCVVPGSSALSGPPCAPLSAYPALIQHQHPLVSRGNHSNRHLTNHSTAALGEPCRQLSQPGTCHCKHILHSAKRCVSSLCVGSRQQSGPPPHSLQSCSASIRRPAQAASTAATLACHSDVSSENFASHAARLRPAPHTARLAPRTHTTH